MQDCVIYDAILPVNTPPEAENETLRVREAGDYANEAQLRNYLRDLIKQNDWRLLQSLITRYSRLLDTACGVEFGYFETADKEPSTKIFEVSESASVIQLPPHIKGSITSVSMNGYELAPHSFFDTDSGLLLYPSRAARCCWAHGNCGNAQIFDVISGWQGTLEVTARWGQDAIRHDVTEAVLSMVAQAYKRRDPVQAVVQGVGGQPFLPSAYTMAWKTVVEQESRNRKWRDFLPA